MKEYLAKYMPVDASQHGPALDSLNALVHWLMLILFVFWAAYFLYVLWRFSAKNNPPKTNSGSFRQSRAPSVRPVTTASGQAKYRSTGRSRAWAYG